MVEEVRVARDEPLVAKRDVSRELFGLAVQLIVEVGQNRRVVELAAVVVAEDVLDAALDDGALLLGEDGHRLVGRRARLCDHGVRLERYLRAEVLGLAALVHAERVQVSIQTDAEARVRAAGVLDEQLVLAGAVEDDDLVVGFGEQRALDLVLREESLA